jgi:hypothetical protein
VGKEFGIEEIRALCQENVIEIANGKKQIQKVDRAIRLQEEIATIKNSSSMFWTVLGNGISPLQRTHVEKLKSDLKTIVGDINYYCRSGGLEQLRRGIEQRITMLEEYNESSESRIQSLIAKAERAERKSQKKELEEAKQTQRDEIKRQKKNLKKPNWLKLMEKRES